MPLPRFYLFLLCFLLVTLNLTARLYIDFNFLDPLGSGFNSPHNTWAKQAVHESAQMFSDWFHEDAVVLVNVLALEDSTDTGRSLPFYKKTDESNLLIQESARHAVLHGLNCSHSSVGYMRLKLNRSWGAPYDYVKSTALHELMHLFGFKSEAMPAFCSSPNTISAYSTFDTFLANPQGSFLIKDAHLDPSFNCNQKIFFAGPNTILANQNSPVPLGSLDPADGYDHLDSSLFKSALMSPFQISKIQTLSPVETAIMSDLGYCMKSAQNPSAPQCNDRKSSFKHINLSAQSIFINDRVFEVLLDGVSISDPSQGNEQTQVIVKDQNGFELLRHPLKDPLGFIDNYDIGKTLYQVQVKVSELSTSYNVSVSISEISPLITQTNSPEPLPPSYYSKIGYKPFYMYQSHKTIDNRTFFVRLDRYKQLNLINSSTKSRKSDKVCIGYVNADTEVVIETADAEVARFPLGWIGRNLTFEFQADDSLYSVGVDYYPKSDHINAYLHVLKTDS